MLRPSGTPMHQAAAPALFELADDKPAPGRGGSLVAVKARCLATIRAMREGQSFAVPASPVTVKKWARDAGLSIVARTEGKGARVWLRA